MINKIIFVLILIMQIGILYQLIEHDHDNRGIYNLIYSTNSKLDSEIEKLKETRIEDIIEDCSVFGLVDGENLYDTHISC